MALSNAERQKRWRERQKTKNLEKFLEDERNRKRAAYVPVKDLCKKQRVKRRRQINKRVKLHYQRKKRGSMTEICLPQEGPSKGTRGKTSNTNATNKMLVKLPSTKKGWFVRKRYKSSLRNAYRKIEELEGKNERLIRSNRKIQKRIERLVVRNEQSYSETDADVSTNLGTDSESLPTSPVMTPRTKTNQFLKSLKISAAGRRILKKRLLFSECLTKDLKNAVKSVDKNVINKLPFYLIRKYRFMSELQKKTGVNRKKKKKSELKEGTPRDRKLKLKQHVTEFLEREDNSTVVVSKKKRDVVEVDQEQHQKRILSDYLHNLHEKYLLENPSKKVSRTSFYNMRSKYLLCANFASRRTCLCSRHQNIALKIKAMRSIGMQCSKSPDVFVREQDTDEKLQKTLQDSIPDEMKYTHWKKITEGTKQRWKEVEENVNKDKFIDLMKEQITDFRKHIERVRNQYAEMRNLRENLPKGEVVLWMDFAENFVCTSVEAVQSSYWNQSMVSLHTMIAYFPSDHDKKLQSYVAVSESLAHNATAVFSIMKKVVPVLKEEYPKLKMMHYLTDSPTSQYRNKTIFKILTEHDTVFDGVSARWNYLESGHGKGPCDGLGASVKRNADMAIRQGKCLIQGAADFFAWAKGTEENGSKVKFIWYDQSDIDSAAQYLQQQAALLPVPGTFQVHAVVPVSINSVMTRELSCYCKLCIKDVRTSNHGWVKHQISQEEATVNEIEMGTEEDKATETGVDIVPSTNDEQEVTVFEEKTWVCALYEGDWFIGKITAVDEKEVEINFLEENAKYGKAYLQEAGKYDVYKWPKNKDQIWVNKTHVITILRETPIPIGMKERTFKISKDEVKRIEELYAKTK